MLSGVGIDELSCLKLARSTLEFKGIHFVQCVAFRGICPLEFGRIPVHRVKFCSGVRMEPEASLPT